MKLYNLLLKKGADKNIKNNNGQTPLELLEIARLRVVIS
jgi:hypothetical protein